MHGCVWEECVFLERVSVAIIRLPQGVAISRLSMNRSRVISFMELLGTRQVPEEARQLPSSQPSSLPQITPLLEISALLTQQRPCGWVWWG